LSTHDRLCPERSAHPRKSEVSTSRRRPDDRDPFGHGAIYQVEEVFSVEQAPGDRNVS
jgi:hypothetical protein